MPRHKNALLYACDHEYEVTFFFFLLFCRYLRLLWHTKKGSNFAHPHVMRWDARGGYVTIRLVRIKFKYIFMSSTGHHHIWLYSCVRSLNEYMCVWADARGRVMKIEWIYSNVCIFLYYLYWLEGVCGGSFCILLCDGISLRHKYTVHVSMLRAYFRVAFLCERALRRATLQVTVCVQQGVHIKRDDVLSHPWEYDVDINIGIILSYMKRKVLIIYPLCYMHMVFGRTQCVFFF